MNPQMLDYYNHELQYLREMGQEFATRYPKVGGQLGLGGSECSDPNVERLLEGIAFLSARVHLKLDSEFSTFVDGLVDLVAPHLSAPRPSAMIARFDPDTDQAALADGVIVPRDTSLRSRVEGSLTPCEFRTTSEIRLWPIQVVSAEYQSRNHARSAEIPGFGSAGSWVELNCRVTSGLKTDALEADSLRVQLNGTTGQPSRLYELLMAGRTRIAVRDDAKPERYVSLPKSLLRACGFDDAESLFPEDARVSRGHRLLAEYFLLPEKFRAIEITGLNSALRQLGTDRFSIVLVCENEDSHFERRVTANDFDLFCTPAINLFPKRADRCVIRTGQRDFHVVPDRSRPTDFEVWRITDVAGYTADTSEPTPFVAAHGRKPSSDVDRPVGLYSVERRRRVASSKETEAKGTSLEQDLGTEVFMTFTDPTGGPLGERFQQVTVGTYCTNRGLAKRLTSGATFGVEIALPVSKITAITGPTEPRPPHVFGGTDSAWKFLSHLSLNYLSLLDSENDSRPAALTELLSLYSNTDDRAARREIDGLMAVTSQPTVAPLPIAGPLVYGRGLRIDVKCDEDCFAGGRSYLFASVLERFFAEYVTINSFTQTTLHSQRGELHQWPPRTGRHATL